LILAFLDLSVCPLVIILQVQFLMMRPQAVLNQLSNRLEISVMFL